MKKTDKRPVFAALKGKTPQELFASLPTPCYIINERQLHENGKILASIAKNTGCKILLAQKAFSNYDFYPLLSKYLVGTEASGLFESRLGAEKMPGKEVHVFCAAYKDDDFDEILNYADHIVFNSPNQLKKFGTRAKQRKKSIGVSDAFLGSISTKDYSNVSSNTPSSDKFYNGTTEYMIFSYAESRFLLAEAAWRGWASAGSAKEHYEEGIKASMDYLKITPEQYSGYMNGGDVPFSTDKEKQLEQIITQKYIAIFPNGHEAWAEFRRTGYPKYLKPVAHPEAGSVPEGQFIKKIQYVNDEYDYNPSHVNDPNLNGGQGDGVNVRVWWDTGKYK